MLMHAGDDRIKTDQMLELQMAISAQVEDLRDENKRDKSAAQEERASKTTP